MNTRNIGNIGETLAVSYLVSKGFTILDRNVYLHWGEIDIIACHKYNIFFFEVKFSRTRLVPEFFYTKNKKRKLLRTINLWLSKNNTSDYSRLITGLIAIHQPRVSGNCRNKLTPSIKVYFEPLY